MTTYTFIVDATPIDVSVKNILSDKSTILYDSYMNKLSCIPIGICNDAKLFNVIVEMYYDFGKFLVPLLENSKFDIVIDYKQLPRYLHVWQNSNFQKMIIIEFPKRNGIFTGPMNYKTNFSVRR